MSGEKIIHVIPLGLEIDRAVKPFEIRDGFVANRVHLITAKVSDEIPDSILEEHRQYAEIVKKKFQSLGVDIQVHYANLIDILEVIRTVSNIIHREKSMGNVVYVNMSAAGRLTSVGSTLSGMVHAARVYYVKADGYSYNIEDRKKHGLSICQKAELSFFENFSINIPDDAGIRVLVELYKSGSMRTPELLYFLHRSGIEGFEQNPEKLSREEKFPLLMRLNRRILEKLEKAEYITKRKIGRENEITITQSGKYIACISGHIE